MEVGIMGNFNNAGLALIKQLEGCRLTAYLDIAGVWTIGYGHTGHEVVPGLAWTQAHADDALQSDITQFATGLAGVVPESLNDNQFSALVIFAFNIGLEAFEGSTACRLVNESNLVAVPAAMAMWNKVRDPSTGALVVSTGLQNRRNAEIGLWNAPV
jgi:lysozyme